MNISARQWLARADRAHRREDMEDFIERAAAGALVEIAETLEEISNALHKAQHATDCWVARAEKAEATIQRVRDACVSSHVDDKGKKVVFLDRIQRALDGAE